METAQDIEGRIEAVNAAITELEADVAAYYVLNFTKSNFGPESSELAYDVDFSDDEVCFSQIDSTLLSVGHLKPIDCTLKMIREVEMRDGVAASIEAVSNLREHYDVPLAQGTIRNHFTALKKRGDVDIGDGAAFTIHGPIGIVNRENGFRPGVHVTTPQGEWCGA